MKEDTLKKQFRKVFWALLLALIPAASGCSSIPKATELPTYLPAENYYLLDERERKSHLQRYLEQNPDFSEESKINFLLESIRDSNSTFIRNGESYQSNMAVFWLRRKVRKQIQLETPVKTAREFIARIATRSNTTMQNYEILLASGERVPSAAVLNASLQRLEDAIASFKLLSAVNKDSQSVQRSDSPIQLPVLLPATH